MSGPLPDGTFAIINANTSVGPTVPEPDTWALTALALGALVLFRKHPLWGKVRTFFPSRRRSAIQCLVAAVAFVAASATSWAQVKMNVSASPSSGVAGVSAVNIVGSAFPLLHGTISPSNVTIDLATSCGGAAAATTTSSSVTVILGSTDRIGFLIPTSLSTGIYFISLTGKTSDGTAFSSLSGSCSPKRSFGLFFAPRARGDA
jgi:hypothetical protein